MPTYILDNNQDYSDHEIVFIKTDLPVEVLHLLMPEYKLLGTASEIDWVEGREAGEIPDPSNLVSLTTLLPSLYPWKHHPDIRKLLERRIKELEEWSMKRGPSQSWSYECEAYRRFLQDE